MMLRSTDKKKKIFFSFFLFLLFSTQITRDKNTENYFSTKLKNIVVVGLSDENNYKIYQSLKFLLKKIFFL